MEAVVTRVGGLPLLPRGSKWPACKTCGAPMLFVLQLRLIDVGPQFAEDDLLCVWHCRAHPEINRAMIVDTEDLEVAKAPGGAVPPSRTDGVALGAGERGDPDAIGMITSKPEWLQAPETVRCEGCLRDMTPVLQLFGDERNGYALACARCRQAAWLFQHR